MRALDINKGVDVCILDKEQIREHNVNNHEICDNGKDDDKDGKVDTNDPECAVTLSNNEAQVSKNQTEKLQTQSNQSGPVSTGDDDRPCHRDSPFMTMKDAKAAGKPEMCLA